jgi:hypothetical protein
VRAGCRVGANDQTMPELRPSEQHGSICCLGACIEWNWGISEEVTPKAVFAGLSRVQTMGKTRPRDRALVSWGVLIASDELQKQIENGRMEERMSIQTDLSGRRAAFLVGFRRAKLRCLDITSPLPAESRGTTRLQLP